MSFETPVGKKGKSKYCYYETFIVSNGIKITQRVVLMECEVLKDFKCNNNKSEIIEEFREIKLQSLWYPEAYID